MSKAQPSPLTLQHPIQGSPTVSAHLPTHSHRQGVSTVPPGKGNRQKSSPPHLGHTVSAPGNTGCFLRRLPCGEPVRRAEGFRACTHDVNSRAPLPLGTLYLHSRARTHQGFLPAAPTTTTPTFHPTPLLVREAQEDCLRLPLIFSIQCPPRSPTMDPPFLQPRASPP